MTLHDVPTDPTPAPELAAAMATAMDALGGVLTERELQYAPPGRFGDDLTALADELLEVLDAVRSKALVAERGARCSWTVDAEPDGFAVVLGIVDFARAGERDAGARPDGPSDPDGPSGWTDTPFHRAAAAYRRECSWDFTPDESGVWVCAFAPTAYSRFGDVPVWHVRGDLIGFVILHDRDEDGDLESLAHVWTARGWRRRGIARALHAVAAERFPLRVVEGPMTDQGAEFIAVAGPDLEEQSD